MQLRLECPICESRFEIEQESSLAMSICPECNRQFKTSTATIATDDKPKREKLILPEQVLTTAALPTRAVQRDADNAVEDQPPAQPKSDDAEVPVKPIKRSFAKQPGKAIPLAVIGALFIIAAGLLVYLPYVVNSSNMPPDDATARNPDQGAAEADRGSPDVEKTGIALKANRSAPAGVLEGFADQQGGFDPKNLDPLPPKRNPKRAPDRNADFFTKVQLEDCWREHHSRIVRLKIANSMGEKLALGTILDSRGWMLTSYRAIAGATQIRVTQTAASFEQFKKGDPLSDFVIFGVVPRNR